MKPEIEDDENLPKSTSGKILIVERRSPTSEDPDDDGREKREEKAAHGTVGDEPNEGLFEDGERADGEAIGTMTMDEESDGCPAGFDSDDEDESAGIFGGELKSIFICKTSHETKATESSARAKVLPLHNPVDGVVKKSEKPPAKLRRKRAISFVDTLITLFVVAPLVIGQWRGIWNMMDIYSELFPEWLCFVLGTGLHALFAIARSGFHGRFVEKWRTYSAAGRVAYNLVRLAYIYIFCVACNAQWRGGWMILNHYFGSNVWVVSFLTVLFIAGLVILRSVRNLLAPPFIVVIDRPEQVFQFPTRYNVE